MTHKTIRWAIKWRAENKRDGKFEHLMWDHGKPLLFLLKKTANEHINYRYGYIRKRPDLRREPHGWKMPVAVKVAVTLTEMPGNTGRSAIFTG